MKKYLMALIPVYGFVWAIRNHPFADDNFVVFVCIIQAIYIISLLIITAVIFGL